jgi:hypothetical protein
MREKILYIDQSLLDQIFKEIVLDKDLRPKYLLHTTNSFYSSYL